VLALLHDHFAPRLIGRDPVAVEAIWKDLFFHTHATAVGAITSLALAAVDTALWDWRARSLRLPLWQLLGGAQPTRARLHHRRRLVASGNRAAGRSDQGRAGRRFRGAKIKVGRPHVSDDVARLAAVRDAVGSGFELMTDPTRDSRVTRRGAAQPVSRRLGWHGSKSRCLPRTSRVMLTSRVRPRFRSRSANRCTTRHSFREYLARGACSIVQADVARIGGITPWLKVAHLAETFNVPICPHFLMELHVGLCAGVPNARWVEFIPQLDDITHSRVQIEDGYALAPSSIGLGIEWNWDVISQRQKACLTVSDGS